MQFSFNNCMYQQTGGIVMGSLLGAALAYIFVGFQEARLFKITNLPQFYKRYGDNTFVIFPLGRKVDLFSTLSTNNILRWHSPVNLSITTAYLSSTSQILAGRCRSIVNQRLLNWTLGAARLPLQEEKSI